MQIFNVENNIQALGQGSRRGKGLQLGFLSQKGFPRFLRSIPLMNINPNSIRRGLDSIPDFGLMLIPWSYKITAREGGVEITFHAYLFVAPNYTPGTNYVQKAVEVLASKLEEKLTIPFGVIAFIDETGRMLHYFIRHRIGR